MDVTLSGIVMLVRLLQPLNVDSPMGSDIVRERDARKALTTIERILSNESDAVRDRNARQAVATGRNAPFPMDVTLSGIVTLVRRGEQLENAESPIDVTPLPITTLVSLLQLENALSPI